MAWRARLLSRPALIGYALVAALLVADYGDRLWAHIGFGGRYQIAPIHSGGVVRLDTKTGELQVFLLGTAEEVALVTSQKPTLGLYPLPAP